jgi:cytochrome c oxidase accessory protein FixG
LFGRVWCGWACPQTVYLEFVFRPIERLFNGTPGRGGAPRKPPSGLMTSLRFLVYTAIAFVLANTFLAYFVGIDTLLDWMQRSPLQHPVSFFVMAGLTAAMLVNFAYFREQLCILACPYGRLQSVLLDKDSSIVSYDALRGDPRGKARKAAAATTLGDCVDCRLCVTTCPTGIDIRDGLQMECINCTQCIDACNAVMHKLGRRPNLIRYSSQNADAGAPRRLLRPRLVIYSLVMVVLATLFVVTLSGGQSFDAVILRNTGQPYSLTETGDVRNVVRLKTTNRSDAERRLWVTVVEPSDVTLHGADDPFVLREGEANTFPLAVVAAPELFVTGQVRLQLRVESDDGDAQSVQFTLLGPMPRPTETP